MCCASLVRRAISRSLRPVQRYRWRWRLPKPSMLMAWVSQWFPCPAGSCSMHSRTHIAPVFWGTVPRLAIEAASKLGWTRYVACEDDVIGMKGFGASAPAERLYEEFGITKDAIPGTCQGPDRDLIARAENFRQKNDQQGTRSMRAGFLMAKDPDGVRRRSGAWPQI